MLIQRTSKYPAENVLFRIATEIFRNNKTLASKAADGQGRER